MREWLKKDGTFIFTDYPIDFETFDFGAVVPSEGEYLWISVGPKWGQGLRAAQGTVERVC